MSTIHWKSDMWFMKQSISFFSLFCILTMFWLNGCGLIDSDSTVELSVPYGTYVFTGEDGTTAQIVVDADSVTIQNGNYDKCAAFHTILAIDRAKAQAQAEGFQLTEEQKNEIQAETEAIDFSAYDGQVLAYDPEQFDETTVNLIPLDEDQSPIWGLLLSYHADTGILGSLGNRAYLLQE